MRPTRTLTAIWLALVGLMMGWSPAWANTRIRPYVEVDQMADWQLDNGGNVDAYTTVSAGFDANVRSRDIEGQASYQYQRYIPWSKKGSSSDVHDGLARFRGDLLHNQLTVEGGAIASRTRIDNRGAGIGLFGGNPNTSQLYGAYAGPHFRTKVGKLEYNAGYEFGYIGVDSAAITTLPAGQPVLDRYGHSTSHNATMSIGMATGDLPFGWTLTGGWIHENVSQLSQRYNGKYARLDTVLPVGPTFALLGGIGYEDLAISQRQPLVDITGNPVINSKGRYVLDPTLPRATAYATDGVTWDVGFTWKPTRRTSLEVVGGRRYGARAITGTFHHELTKRVSFEAGYYDAIDSFGRSITRQLASLPTSFVTERNPFTGTFGNCVFGNQPGSGGCFGNAMQSATTANFRSHGAYGVLSGRTGPWIFGAGVDYVRQKFIAPRATTTFFNINGTDNRILTTELEVSRSLSSNSTMSAGLQANWYKSGLANSPNVRELSLSGTYRRSFTEHVIGYGSLGLYNDRINGQGSSTHAYAGLGLRYQF